PVFTFSDPGRPYSIDYFNSRAQVQLGVRYTF
ncbi:outer membrane insertion C-terminal signal, partial [Parapedobacter composti]